MVYKVKLRFGSYSLHGVGNFEVGEEKIVSEDIYNYLSTVTAFVADKHFPYFDTWIEEDKVATADAEADVEVETETEVSEPTEGESSDAELTGEATGEAEAKVEIAAEPVKVDKPSKGRNQGKK